MIVFFDVCAQALLAKFTVRCLYSAVNRGIFCRFYRVTACNATHGIAVAILPVRPSVRPSDACIATKLNDGLRIL